MQDRELKLMSGWPAVVAMLLGLGLIVLLIVVAAAAKAGWMAAVIVPLGLVWFVCLFGFIVNGPNHARVVQLFGKYVGTLTDVGFFWGNPFYATNRVSLRVRTFETGMVESPEVKDATGKVTHQATKARQPRKVNDRDGTPIEIAAVVVWKVVNSAEAVFKVDDVRGVRPHPGRRGAAEPGEPVQLRRPRGGRVHPPRAHRRGGRAAEARGAGPAPGRGGRDQEARISYLAYAPEIAAAMLQRQQAGAIVAARTLIVEGAVGMVEHALES